MLIAPRGGEGRYQPVLDQRYPPVLDRRDWRATPAMVCGIVGLFVPPVGIAGLLFGLVARGAILRSGKRLRGIEMAWVGIILGSIATLGQCCGVCFVISAV